MRLKPEGHLAFVVLPPHSLCAAIERQQTVARGIVADCPAPLSPPHVTMLYIPCNMLDRTGLRRAVATVRSTIPFTLRYGGVRVTSYGTVQLAVEPYTMLHRLHVALLNAVGLDAYADAPASRLFDMFGTANFGTSYAPHITLGRFSTSSQAETLSRCFTSLPETDQPLTTICIADATGPLSPRLLVNFQGLD